MARRSLVAFAARARAPARSNMSQRRPSGSTSRDAMTASEIACGNDSRCPCRRRPRIQTTRHKMTLGLVACAVGVGSSLAGACTTQQGIGGAGVTSAGNGWTATAINASTAPSSVAGGGCSVNDVASGCSGGTCGALYDCGSTTCQLGKPCPGFSGTSLDKAAFIQICEQRCTAQLAAGVNPAFCDTTVLFVSSATWFSLACKNGVGG